MSPGGGGADNSGTNDGLVIGLSVGLSFGAAFVMFCCFLYHKKRKSRRDSLVADAGFDMKLAKNFRVDAFFHAYMCV